MENKTIHWLIIFYLLGFVLVYIPTIGLWGNTAGLRALHIDLPSSAGDAAFRAKAMANFFAGVVMLVGCCGLLRRQDWGRPVTVIGLVCQMVIYVTEVAIFRYLNALGMAALVIPLNIAIIFHLNRNRQMEKDKHE